MRAAAVWKPHANLGGAMSADMNELLERYEAAGGEGDDELFEAARPLFERALSEAPDDLALLRDYGYLMECHGRYALRRAVAQYERALELYPDADKVRYQLISARAALGEAELSTALYRQRLAAAPDQVREYRFLARAHTIAREFAEASAVVDAGLRLFPDDPLLLEVRAEVRAGTGDPDGALADWRRAHDLDPENLGPVYESAFLLEREGRLEQAVAVWRSILAWNQARGYDLQIAWPMREIERLEGRTADR